MDPQPGSDFDYAASGRKSLLLRFFGHSAVYSASSLLLRLGNFLLLPLYWSRLAPADFGVLAISELLGVGLLGVLTLGLEAGITRFYHEWTGEERPARVGAVWLAGLAGSAAITLAALGVAWLLWERVLRQVPFFPWVPLALAGAYARSFSSIPFALLRVQERLYRFSLVSLATFAVNAAAGLYLVLHEGMGARGVLWAAILGHGAAALFWIAYMLRATSFRGPRDTLRPVMAYCLPLVPASLLSWAGSLGDRFFLDRYAPLHDVGLYSVGQRFANVAKEANQSLKNSWIPFTMRLAHGRPDGIEVIGRLATWYVAALLGFALGAALLSREFIAVFDSGTYAAAYAFVPALAAAAFLDVFDVLSGFSLAYEKRTRVILLLSVLEAALLLGLVGVLAKWHGARGAMFGVLAGRFLSAGVRMAVSRSVRPVPFEYGKWAGMTLLALSIGAAAWSLPPLPLAGSVAAKTALLLAFAAACGFGFLDWRRALREWRAPRA